MMADSTGDLQDARYFTLDEAHAILPRVRELVDTLQAYGTRLRALQRRLEAFRESKRMGQDLEGEAGTVRDLIGEAQQIAGEMRSLLDELDKTGCEVKDVEMGLVDFRSLRDGRPVYLCWRAGEDEIRYWHELDTGFAGRQPL